MEGKSTFRGQSFLLGDLLGKARILFPSHPYASSLYIQTCFRTSELRGGDCFSAGAGRDVEISGRFLTSRTSRRRR